MTSGQADLDLSFSSCLPPTVLIISFSFICLCLCCPQKPLWKIVDSQNLSVVVFFSQIEVLNKYLFLTSKPMIYLVNLSEKDYIRRKNKW